MTRVTVVDHGAGNLRSLRAALERLDAAVEVTASAEAVAAAELVVLPGVGAAGAAMRRLRAAGLDGAIRAAVDAGAGLVGVCLGLQLLFERSEEDGAECLGLLPGAVRRIGWAARVPHMGWNEVTAADGGHALGATLPAVCYFAHTFVAEPAEAADVVATTELDGRAFASAVARGRIAGVQFHPERSGPAGRRVLATLVRKRSQADFNHVIEISLAGFNQPC